nr:zinc finger, CCHC-type [Tanacetum cinerariifolium]
MASNFAKLDKFEGVNFRRWQKKMHFLLSSMSVVYVLTTPIPEDSSDDATVKEIKKKAKWDNDDYVYRGLILNGGSSTQVTMSLSSSDDDIDIQAILSRFEGNDCSPMPNNANNNWQQQIAANQQHGMVCLGSNDDDLWSFMSAFHNMRGHQDGQSSFMAKRNRLNLSSFNRNQQQQMAGSTHKTLIQHKPNIGKQGIRHNIKQEPLEIGRDSDQLHPNFPPQLTRSTFVQAPWNKSPSPVNINVKEDQGNFLADQWRCNLESWDILVGDTSQFSLRCLRLMADCLSRLLLWRTMNLFRKITITSTKITRIFQWSSAKAI